MNKCIIINIIRYTLGLPILLMLTILGVCISIILVVINDVEEASRMFKYIKEIWGFVAAGK